MRKIYPRIVHLQLILMFLPLLVRSQELNIGNGAQLVMDGSINLVITDAGLSNNGSLVSQGGTVAFKGTASSAASFIGGSSTTSFNILSINKSANHVTLTSDISVKNSISLLSNNILLNNKEISLGATGTLQGENENSFVAGFGGGSIKAEANLNAPNQINPGKLGLEITSSSNLGTTLIRRYNTVSTLDADNTSIKRYYDITPTNNTGLNATLKMVYLDAELGSVSENDLELWSSENSGANWQRNGKDAASTTSNFIQKSGLTSLNRVTLGTNFGLLPVEWLSFIAELQNEQTLLKWTTASENNNNRFEVLRSGDGKYFEVLSIHKSMGTGSNEYTFIDFSPLPGISYYAIKQIDNNGRSSISERRTVKKLGTVQLQAFPNPVKNEVNLVFYSSKTGSSLLKLYNAAGILVASRSGVVQLGINSIQWSLSNIPSGVYFIRFDNLGIAPVQIIKE